MLKNTILLSWKKLIKFFEDNHEITTKLKFLIEQFELACYEKKAARRYSPEMLLQAFMIHMLSPACYDGLRVNLLLTQPHEKRLEQLSRSSSVAVEDIRSNKHFLQQLIRDNLKERGKYIVLQIDEIYVKRKID